MEQAADNLFERMAAGSLRAEEPKAGAEEEEEEKEEAVRYRLMVTHGDEGPVHALLYSRDVDVATSTQRYEACAHYEVLRDPTVRSHDPCMQPSPTWTSDRHSVAMLQT